VRRAKVWKIETDPRRSVKLITRFLKKRKKKASCKQKREKDRMGRRGLNGFAEKQRKKVLVRGEGRGVEKESEAGTQSGLLANVK